MGINRNIRVTRHGIRFHNVDLSLIDDKNRSVEIGPATGLLARDAGGTIIHDIPNAPVQTGRYYCGHMVWFTDDTQYKIFYDASAWTNNPYNSWKTGIATVTGGNSNIKAGIFKVQVSANWSSGAATVSINVQLRPYGASWSYTTSNNTPGLGFRVYYDGTNAPHIYGILICPLGTDGKIDTYVGTTSANLNGGTQTITQLGVLI